MPNNRIQRRYSSFLPEFPRRNTNRNYYNSVERRLSSIGDVGTTGIRESWRHNPPSARRSSFPNAPMNWNGGRQSYDMQMQHGDPTLSSNSILGYSASTSLDTTSDNENRIGVNRQNNIIVQGRDANSSNVSDVNRDHANYGVVIDTDQTGSSSSPSHSITHTISTEPNNSEPMTNSRAASGPDMPVCAVCLDDYKEVLSMGHHIVAVSCGHTFCNICTNRLKTSRTCPKCRSRITRRILRLYF